MIKICSFGLVFMCFAFIIFEKNASRNGEERITEVFKDISTTEAYEFNVKTVRKQDNRSLPCENLNISLENIQCDVNESRPNERGSGLNVKEMNRKIGRDVILDEATLVVGKANARSNVADKKVMIVFDEKARIDGFKVTSPEEAPYAVVVRVLWKDRPLGVCSGSLITALWVLTAAHCFQMEYDQVIVYAGGNSVDEMDNEIPLEGSAWRPKKEVYTHPLYRKMKKAHFDIALVELETDFELTATVNTVNLSLNFWEHNDYQACQITAFGRVNKEDDSFLDNRRKTHFLEVNNDCECIQMRALVMCSKPREDYGVCSGDSGGGLICDGELVALAVGMLAFKNIDTCTLLDRGLTQECGVRDSLNVFQQICPYIRWLVMHVSSIDKAGADIRCYDPSTAVDYDKDYEHWGDDYHSDDYEDGGNFDTVARTSNLLLFTCSLVLLVYRANI